MQKTKGNIELDNKIMQLISAFSYEKKKIFIFFFRMQAV
ncbi:hypothetical protein PU02_0088 [Bartonella ancashensis]|uniref:Uncharacterized protein n=1 Tax=Bartonella ancashensis TaxID=1318743 RepID=A0A0M4LIK1_9HYPH|nr:hypothetical protein PU02_0088 [Bartonella ancashensis]